MSVRRSVLWVACAVALGLVERLLTGLAGDTGAGPALLDLVNWGAPWIVAPVLAGRAARSTAIAVATGCVLAAVEVAVYYVGVAWPPSAATAWLLAGAVGGGCFALVSHLVRRRAAFWLLIPGAFVVEPVLTLLALSAVGRRPWSSWQTSAPVEFAVGVMGCLVVLALRRRDRRPRRERLVVPTSDRHASE